MAKQSTVGCHDLDSGAEIFLATIWHFVNSLPVSSLTFDLDLADVCMLKIKNL